MSTIVVVFIATQVAIIAAGWTLAWWLGRRGQHRADELRVAFHAQGARPADVIRRPPFPPEKNTP